jgi:hypothetical protein
LLVEGGERPAGEPGWWPEASLVQRER